MGWIGFFSTLLLMGAYMLEFHDPVGNIRGLFQGFFFLVTLVWWFGTVVTFYKATRHH
jgi:hypothetical protein